MNTTHRELVNRLVTTFSYQFVHFYMGSCILMLFVMIAAVSLVFIFLDGVLFVSNMSSSVSSQTIWSRYMQILEVH